MKINEVIQEGIINTVKGFIPGTAARAVKKSTKQQNTVISNVVKNLLQQWGVVQANLQKSNQTPTPQQVAQWFEKFAGTQVSSAPANTDASTISNWLTQEVSSYLASKQLGTPEQTPPTQPTPAQTAPAQTAPATAGVPGFEVISQEPVVVRYKKVDYSLNDEGEWIVMGAKGKLAPLIKDSNPTLEKLLDRAAGTEQTQAQSAQTAQTAQTAAGEPKIIGKVTTPGGVEVVKWSDNIWTIPDTKEQVVKPNDITQLENLLSTQQATTAPHTGGKQKGVLSQTPNAIRKRQNRAAQKEMPAVFKSNRPQA